MKTQVQTLFGPMGKRSANAVYTLFGVSISAAIVWFLNLADLDHVPEGMNAGAITYITSGFIAAGSFAIAMTIIEAVQRQNEEKEG